MGHSTLPVLSHAETDYKDSMDVMRATLTLISTWDCLWAQQAHLAAREKQLKERLKKHEDDLEALNEATFDDDRKAEAFLGKWKCIKEMVKVEKEFLETLQRITAVKAGDAGEALLVVVAHRAVGAILVRLLVPAGALACWRESRRNARGCRRKPPRWPNR